MYKKIGDYGIIGDLQSIALVGLDGSIDWMCLPHIDSPSIFGALLDDKKGGKFSITPLDEWDSVAEYLPGTNILQTRFRTRTGVMRLTDFMPVCACGREEMEEVHALYRCIEIIRGVMQVRIIFDPRFDYARADTILVRNGNTITAEGGGEKLSLACTHAINAVDDRRFDIWTLSEGSRVWFRLNYGDGGPDALDDGKAEKALTDTAAYWKGWLNISETGRAVDLGPYKDMVERSALVLKLLYYEPTGAISAASTTSLPEEIGGERNWDYRYTWVRDASFTLQALFNLGHLSETEGYIRWIEKLLSEHGAGEMQIMYGLRGETELPEKELAHLDGYKGSGPVRAGNAAAAQKQLDIYGELMDAVLKLSDYVGKIDAGLWPFLHDICEHVVNHWRDRDYGIWEVRGGPHDFVYSKVMCWVALDRGILIAERYGFPADLNKWRDTCESIKKDVLERGWNEKKQSFVQHYDTDALDSSNLLIPALGFLPYADSKVISTIEATKRELGHNGFLYRYLGEDGLSGEEGTFLLCTFWLINNLVALGQLGEAEHMLHNIEDTANHLGLFSEQYDVTWKESLGNFPQAFTHIGYINSVMVLQQARKMNEGSKREHIPVSKIHLARKIVLNEGNPRDDITPGDIAARLKNSMNVLRGAFFDTTKGRVAYELMKGSPAYEEYLGLSYSLKKMDMSDLVTPEQKIAFWVNLYNVIVIHGVVELGVRDSVKEVRNIFRRIQYQIDDMFFSPEDIEHGILRGNRRPPNSLFRKFGREDRRLSFSVREMDPRIHFALVCASSSCPPIEVYTAENLDEELTIAGRTFINGGGVILDRRKNRVSLSRVFKWYAEDFGSTPAERLKFLSQYLYDDDQRSHLFEKAGDIRIDYQDYDWRLNRSEYRK